MSSQFMASALSHTLLMAFGVFKKKIDQTSSRRIEGLKLALKIQKDLKHDKSKEVEIGVLEQKAWGNQKG